MPPSQTRLTAGYGADDQPEPVAFSQALLPGPWNPAVAAKQIATIRILADCRQPGARLVPGRVQRDWRRLAGP
jgi:hypothetical protein